MNYFGIELINFTEKIEIEHKTISNKLNSFENLLIVHIPCNIPTDNSKHSQTSKQR